MARGFIVAIVGIGIVCLIIVLCGIFIYRGNDVQHKQNAENKTSNSPDLYQNSSLDNMTRTQDGSIYVFQDSPDLCQNSSLDAMTRTQDGSIYVFQGDFYWKIINYTIAEGYARRIVEDWIGLEGNLDASFTGPGGKTFFFKGRHFWRFTNKNMDSGYPKLISEKFSGLPDNVDAAFFWKYENSIYIIKGDKCLEYSLSKQSIDGDKSLLREEHSFPGLPLNAAFAWNDTLIYLFSGSYYLTSKDDDKSSRYATAPFWFSCPNNATVNH